MYKVYCRIYCGGGASCPGLEGLFVFIKFIVEYIVAEGLQAPRLGELNICIKFIVEYIVEEGLQAPGLGV